MPTADTAWMDALPAVSPPPGMVLPKDQGASTGAAPAQQAPPVRGALPDWAIHDQPVAPANGGASSGATSWMDKLPEVAPTTGMQIARADLGDKSTWKGIAAAIPSGLYAGIAATPNLPTYALNAASSVLRGFGLPYGQMTPPIDVNPTGYQPHGAPERAVYAGAQAVGSLPGMALGGEMALPFTAAGSVPRAVAQGLRVPTGAPSVATAGEGIARALPGAMQAPVRGAADLASNLPIGAVSQAVGAGGMVGQAASEAVPERYAPIANVAGILLGAGGLAGLQAGISNAARGAGDMLGRLGVGPKTDFGGVRVTPQQADIVAQRVTGALGPEGYDLLQAEPPNAVPGYEPTLAQIAPTPGAVALEKSFRTARSVPFMARGEQQNAAQIGAVAGMGGEGNPASVGQFFTSQLDALRGQGDAATQDARAGVQGMTEDLGGKGTPEGYGATAAAAIDRAQAPRVAQAQAGVDEAQAARDQAVAGLPGGKLTPTPDAGPVTAQYGAAGRAQLLLGRQEAVDREAALWNAINPDGMAGGPAAPIKDRVAAAYSDLSPDAKPPTGEEAAILSRITGWPDQIRLTDIQALRSRVGDAIDTEVNAAGRTQTDVSRRLMGVKGAIDAGLQEMIDQQAAREAADVAAGRMAPGETMLGRLQGELRQPDAGTLGTPAAGSGAVRPGQSERSAGTGATGAAGEGGTAGAGTGRPGNAGGNRGVAAAEPAPLGTERLPPSLLDFLISRGGVRDQGGDISSMGGDAYHHQRGGRLINPRGATLDYAREAAEEAGYLRPNSGITDLLDAIGEELSGRKVYTQSEAADAMLRVGARAEADRQAAAYDRARSAVSMAESDAGARLSDDEIEHATQLAMQGVHPHEAINLASRASEEAALQRNAQASAFGSPGIPLAEQREIPGTRPGRPARPFTQEELTGYQRARAATQDRARTFDERRVGEALAPGEYRTAAEVPESITRARGGFNIADEQLMSKFWNKGPTQASDAQDFLKAGGSADLLKDYAADDLRARAVGLDGTFDPKAFAKWRRDHGDALLAFPELRAAFDGAAHAQETLAARQAELAAVQESHPLRGVGFQSQIMGKYWRAGDEGADRVRQYLADTRNDPAAQRALDDFAVYKMREAGVIEPDGTLDAKKFGRYMADHARAISERPELGQRLRSVQAAQTEYDRVIGEHARALQDYQTKSVQAFLGDDPMQAIRSVFEARDSSGAMRDVIGKLRGNDDAVAGLRRLAADYILKRLSSLVPEGASQRDYLNARAFRQWVDTHKSAVRLLYGGQGLQMLDAIAANMRRQAPRTMATPGSDTVPKAMGLIEHGLAPTGEKGASGVALALIAEHAGEHMASGLGGPAAVAALFGRHLWSAMRQTGARRVGDLTTEVLLHPTTVGRALLDARVRPDATVRPMVQRRIAAALLAASVSESNRVTEKR